MSPWIALLGLAASSAGSGSDAGKPVFSCSLGHKQVTVRAVGKELIYQFGMKGRTELTIVGSVVKRNLFYRAARFSNIENQLRFTNGRFSYIVFSLGRNPSVGASGVSGLAILDGTKHVSDMTCRHWTDLETNTFESWKLPEDGEQYSAV